MSEGNPNLPSLFLKTTELIKLANVYLNHAPRHEKYGLCQEIRQTMYEMFGLISDSYESFHKKTTLSNLNRTHKKLKMFFNLYYELGYLNYKHHKREKTDAEARRRLTALTIILNEIGKMIGGWIKYDNEQKRGK